MNGSKVACYHNLNVCFDLEFIAKRNAFLRTGSSERRSEIRTAEKHQEGQRDIDYLQLVDERT